MYTTIACLLNLILPIMFGFKGTQLNVIYLSVFEWHAKKQIQIFLLVGFIKSSMLSGSK
jgi:hypothetical protein